MAGTFKDLDSVTDKTTTRTLLHEAIPLTGSIVSGTYGNSKATEENIKNFAHGMFQSVYDYPYLSSSANHIFDVTVGYSAASGLSSSTNVQNQKKINIYNEMSQLLMGYSSSGEILEFDQDGNLAAGGTKMRECFFMNFSRLLVKDEIKKGTFNLELGVSGAVNSSTFKRRIKLTDKGAASNFLINSPSGEYGILYADSTAGTNLAAINGSTVADDGNMKVGLIFYQAGIAVVTGAVFVSASYGGGALMTSYGNASPDVSTSRLTMSIGSNETITGYPGRSTAKIQGEAYQAMITGSEISGAACAVRHRIYNVEFQNTTEINSTIYYCRVNHGDYNYSTNPTYTSGSKIVVKDNSTDQPVSYITAVGLYSADNELLAVAKLSEPLKKDPATEFTIRVRLDY